jgi:hypothetical protein
LAAFGLCRYLPRGTESPGPPRFPAEVGWAGPVCCGCGLGCLAWRLRRFRGCRVFGWGWLGWSLFVVGAVWVVWLGACGAFAGAAISARFAWGGEIFGNPAIGVRGFGVWLRGFGVVLRGGASVGSMGAVIHVISVGSWL